MKKFISVLCALALCIVSASAETDYVAMPVIQDIQQGVNNGNQITTLRVSGAATIGGKAAVVTASATVVDLVQRGAVTVTADATTYTQVFATVYTSVPQVFLQSTLDGAAVKTNTIVPVVSSNKFTVVMGVNTNFQWLAIGPKP